MSVKDVNTYVSFYLPILRLWSLCFKPFCRLTNITRYLLIFLILMITGCWKLFVWLLSESEWLAMFIWLQLINFYIKNYQHIVCYLNPKMFRILESLILSPLSEVVPHLNDITAFFGNYSFLEVHSLLKLLFFSYVLTSIFSALV